MSLDYQAKYDVDRYRPLGLIANPFVMQEQSFDFGGQDLEMVSEANELLGALMASAEKDSAKPVAVIKDPAIPSLYSLRAVGLTERSLASDDGVGILHAYIPLFMMRLGRVRSIISVLAERLVFHDFDTTLSLYIEKVLQETDTDLVSYQMLGDEKLAEFAERFAADSQGVTLELFGGEEVERHPELMEIADTREVDLPSDVDEEDAAPELDSTMGDSPANAVLLAAEQEEPEVENDDRALVDYIVEYTQVHLSPVVARALRVYRERGQIALINELKVTKAPKKTLAAIVKFAKVRFKKVALIYDGFEGWITVPEDMKTQIAATLTEIRWMLDKDAIMVFALEEDAVPELEEPFGHGTRLNWKFSALAGFEEDAQLMDVSILNSWLARAAAPGAEPLTIADPVLAALADEAEGLVQFARSAHVAIEDAAERGVSALDEPALEAGRGARLVEATKE